MEYQDYSFQYNALHKLFRDRGEAIPVDFRAIVSRLSSSERATHLIHPYPAKLIRHIPYFFLGCKSLSDNEWIMDPFSGSGTVLLEGILAGRRSVGADSNPLARLITRVKTTILNREEVWEQAKHVVMSSKVTETDHELFRGRLKYWYPERIFLDLTGIQMSIRAVRDQRIQDFLQVAFSVCSRRLSLADPRLPVPVRMKPEKLHCDHWIAEEWARHLQLLETASAADEFLKACEDNLRRADHFRSMAPSAQPAVLLEDARSFSDYSGPAPSLIVTSPPYIAAQKYMRSSSLALAWQGYTETTSLRALESTSIGREFVTAHEKTNGLLRSGLEDADDILMKVLQKNPNRAYVSSLYLHEMQSALASASKTLAVGGTLVIVAGVNQVAGEIFATHAYLSQMLTNQGLTLELELVDQIKSRGLMTKRNRGANVMLKEHVLVFRKEG